MQPYSFIRAFKFTSFLALMLFTVLLTGTLYAAPKVGPVTPENSIIGQYTDDRIGSGGVYSLPNGNIVIVNAYWNSNSGAVICLTPNEYKTGGILISAANALVGSNAGDNVGLSGITVLSNGNYVVSSPDWNNKIGAATWVNGATCLPYGESSRGAVVSGSNSLVGSNVNDRVSYDAWGTGVTALNNGNYVVASPYWNSHSGAATWVNGSTGTAGTISAANSLIGSNGDTVSDGGITALSNGNYVVASPHWANDTIPDVGAATWGNGATGLVGLVSPANSLIGSQENDLVGRRIGEEGHVLGVTALTNGNYVVSSRSWNNGAGAATWGDGSTGTVGVVSVANSLIGLNEHPDFPSEVSEGGITVLANGNYVVSSPHWNNAEVSQIGAVTWGDGSTGTVGIVSAANSLIGSNQGDFVGIGGITPLTNGNYVVISIYWNNYVGAATWGDGSTGTVGIVDMTNSLVGSQPYDLVSATVTPLTNGNYVVSSDSWHNFTGAATWGDGAMGTVGIVDSTNSLVGSNSHDLVGSTVTPLTNGNYVVKSESWNNFAGAVTWGDGTAGTVGIVDMTNSIVGSQPYDLGGSKVIPLINGNYVVSSPQWANGAVAKAGAVTWGNGSVGTVGIIGAQNSLVGTISDPIISMQVVPLSNGNYVVSLSSWDIDTVANVGAVLLADGASGTFGTFNTSNALIGTTSYDFVGDGGIHALTDGSFIVSSPYWDNGAIQNVGAITWSDGTLVAPNSAPILAEIGNKTVDVGETLTFDAEATDSDDPTQTLRFSIDGAPEDASFDTATGEFSWTPDEADSGQTFNVTLTVTDDGAPALSDSEAFTITVSPVIVEETNYLPNASFENPGTTNKTAAGWNGVGLTTNDKRICDTETKTYAHDGECAFRFQFNGATAPARTLQRNLNVQNFAKNDVVELRGMVKASGLTAGAKFVLKVVYNNGKTEAVSVKLTADSYEYTPFATPQLTLKRPAKKITAQIRAGSAKGTFLVDDMAVVKVAAPLTIESGTTDSDLRGLD